MKEKKNKKSIDIRAKEEHNDADDIVFDDVDDEAKSLENIKSVRAKLKKCETEKKEYLDGWQRAKADFVNTKKRDEENRLNSIKFAKQDVIESIIPVLDSFELAFVGEDAEKKLDKNWLAGMKGIQSQLVGVINGYGVTQMNPIGEEFDPNLHDSVESRKTDDKAKDGIVIEVRQNGYMLDGKVIRAAKVVVAQFKD